MLVPILKGWKILSGLLPEGRLLKVDACLVAGSRCIPLSDFDTDTVAMLFGKILGSEGGRVSFRETLGEECPEWSKCGRKAVIVSNEFGEKMVVYGAEFEEERPIGRSDVVKAVKHIVDEVVKPCFKNVDPETVFGKTCCVDEHDAETLRRMALSKSLLARTAKGERWRASLVDAAAALAVLAVNPRALTLDHDELAFNPSLLTRAQYMALKQLSKLLMAKLEELTASFKVPEEKVDARRLYEGYIDELKQRIVDAIVVTRDPLMLAAPALAARLACTDELSAIALQGWPPNELRYRVEYDIAVCAPNCACASLYPLDGFKLVEMAAKASERLLELLTRAPR